MWRSVAPQLLGRQIPVALVLLCGQVRTVPPHLFHLRLTAAFRLSAPRSAKRPRSPAGINGEFVLPPRY
jgi:hypothetical protein